MSAPSKVRPQTAEMPPVPLTLEGSSVLHQMLRFRWTEWRRLNPGPRNHILNDAQPVLQEMEKQQSALYSLLGHKGDLMLVHFRASFDELKQAELDLARTGLSDYLETTTSY
jgi:chlorite dismutase